MDLSALWFLLAVCFALGMLHGTIPDEHTWPITFAYSIGTTTGRGGIRSAAWFSMAFTAQRALMSMIVYLALSAAIGAWGFNLATADAAVNGPVYIAVGLAMAVAGFLILTNRIGHFHPFMRVSKNDLAKHTGTGSSTPSPDAHIPTHWCIIHGFISGFGTDSSILSTWIYITTILLFLVPNHLWFIGWLPGFLFGLGTFLVLMLVGFFFGKTLQVAKRFGPNRIAQFGRLVGARTLLFGGIAFVAFGPLYWTGWYAANVGLDAGQFIVLLVLVGMAVPTMLYTWREVQKLPRHLLGDGGEETTDSVPPSGPSKA
jgi:ABC-type nickel/cobalt efflux system permease component RcnA